MFKKKKAKRIKQLKEEIKTLLIENERLRSENKVIRQKTDFVINELLKL